MRILIGHELEPQLASWGGGTEYELGNTSSHVHGVAVTQDHQVEGDAISNELSDEPVG